MAVHRPTGGMQHFACFRPESIEDTLGQALPVLKEAGILDAGLTHVASRTYHLKCNWKVFCDNVSRWQSPDHCWGALRQVL